MALLIPLSVGYDSDPDRVEGVVREEAVTSAGEISGLLVEPASFVRFVPGFGDHSLDLTLICQVATFVDRYLVQHELRKRLLRWFWAEGSEIPYPMRAVVLKSASNGVRDERPMSHVVFGGLYDGQPFTAEKPPGNLCEPGAPR